MEPKLIVEFRGFSIYLFSGKCSKGQLIHGKIRYIQKSAV